MAKGSSFPLIDLRSRGDREALAPRWIRNKDVGERLNFSVQVVSHRRFVRNKITNELLNGTARRVDVDQQREVAFEQSLADFLNRAGNPIDPLLDRAS